MFVSCNYLDIDKYFSDEIKIDSVFSNKRNLEAYIWGIANEFNDEGSYMQNADTPGTYATDECFTMNETLHGYNGLRLVLNEINANATYTFGDVWTNGYQAIRRCNTVFARVDEARDLEPIERAELLALNRFMRAYAYYKMWLNFGPLILLGDEEIPSNLDLAEYDRARATNDETVEYICAELEEAAKYLPVTRPLAEFGRPTKGAAYGIIARLRLYHASPLWNAGEPAKRCFGDWYRSTDGAPYVNTKEYDETRWAKAAAAAKRVMELTNGGAPMYKLYTVQSNSQSAKYVWSDQTTNFLPEGVEDANYYNEWPNGAAGIDHFRSYNEIFTGEAVMQTNPEFVWGRPSATLRNNTQMSFPVKQGGWSAMALTQKMIDGFRMVDGKTINESSANYPYSTEGFTESAKDFGGYHLNQGVYNMYANREMRFYANVGFCERYWTMSSATEPDNVFNETIRYYYDNENGRQYSPVDYTPTGYVNVKFIHPQDAWTGTNSRRMDKAYAIVRYSDILLMYAEALSNLTQEHEVTLGEYTTTVSRDVEEIKYAFNQVRYRAGLPGLTDAEVASHEAFQPVLEQERMIELLCENHRYFDVRRWGIYEREESIPVQGMNIDGNKDTFYQVVVPNTSRVASRLVHKKLYLLPIPLSEIRRLPSCDQNPGWED